jgi:hypothetical protein
MNSNTITLTNTIIANSTNGGDCINKDTIDPSSTNNLIEDDTCSSAFPPGTDPNLGPLQNNGGPTFTHALLAGSPAIGFLTELGHSQKNPIPQYFGTCFFKKLVVPTEEGTY